MDVWDGGRGRGERLGGLDSMILCTEKEKVSEELWS